MNIMDIPFPCQDNSCIRNICYFHYAKIAPRLVPISDTSAEMIIDTPTLILFLLNPHINIFKWYWDI